MSEPLILGVITARGGSKGIPKKNIKLLGDKPLIAYTIEVAKKSSLLSHLIVSTDDPEIAEVAKKYGADVPFMRPAELALDTTPHLPVMQHAISFMEAKLGVRFDYAAIFQPTSPFRTKEDIDGTLQKLIDTGADSSVTLVEAKAHEHPIKMKKIAGDFIEAYCIPEPEGIRRQDIDKAYRRSGALYAMRRDLLMEENRLYGERVTGIVTPEERSIDIDTPEDWTRAEDRLKTLRKAGYDF